MVQLKMYWLGLNPVSEYPLPEGFSISNYRSKKDMLPWVECCKNGLLQDDANENDFVSQIKKHKDIKMKTDVFFLDYNGEHIGTITAVYHRRKNIGEIHMVGIKKDFRGKGLGKILNSTALNKLKAQGVDYVYLTTDEWRASAVKSYLSAGFLPVEYDMGMKERWEKVLKEHSIPQCDMLFEDASYCRTIYRETKNSAIAPVTFR